MNSNFDIQNTNIGDASATAGAGVSTEQSTQSEASSLTDTKHSEDSISNLRIGSLTDVGWSALDSGIAQPYNATLGHILPQIDVSDLYDHDTVAAKTGSIGGMVADVMVLSKVTNGLIDKSVGRAAQEGLLSSALSENQALTNTLGMGVTGAVYGGVFTEGSPTERLKNAAVDFSTFATLGGVSSKLESINNRSFLQTAKNGALSGMTAGVVDAEARSLVNGKGFNLDSNDVGKSAAFYGIFGATMGGASYGLESTVPKLLRSFKPQPEQEIRAEPVPEIYPRYKLRTKAEDAIKTLDEATASKKFDFPAIGKINLEKMIAETPPADHFALFKQAMESRPDVQIYDWMRAVGVSDMETFLLAAHKVNPENYLGNAHVSIERGFIYPLSETKASEPPEYDLLYNAWEKAFAKITESTKPNSSID